MTRHANAAKHLAALLADASPDVAQGNAATLAALQADARTEIAAALRQVETSPLAARFEGLWRQLGGPELAREYRFHPARKWRADYCHTATKTIVELEGGIFSGGRHSRGGRSFLADIDKYNAAAMLGYTVLRLGTGQVDAAHVGEIVECVKAKGW